MSTQTEIEKWSISLVLPVSRVSERFLDCRIIDIGHADKIIHVESKELNSFIDRLERHPCACDWLDELLKEEMQ